MLYKHCLCVCVLMFMSCAYVLCLCLMSYVMCAGVQVYTRISQVKSVSFSCARTHALLLFLFLTNNYGFCEKVEQIANFHCFFAIFLRFFLFFFVCSFYRV